MTLHLKPLGEQVVVGLGASSGIGRASASRLAARGARLVADLTLVGKWSVPGRPPGVSTARADHFSASWGERVDGG